MPTTQTNTPVSVSISAQNIDSLEKGVTVETDFFALNKIGATLRLEPEAFYFPDESLPRQALAVSHNPATLFLAHLTGFYVAKAERVLWEAEAKPESDKKLGSVAKFSFNVQIGRVRILSVSMDNSTLAASVDLDIHFFDIASLLKHDKNTLSLYSVDEPSGGFVSDFRWRKNSELHFLLLSSNHTLYHGELGSPLSKLRENVDAVDWITCGGFIAVGQQNSLTILSATFEDLRILSIPPETSYHLGCHRKVDSINWIRRNCIFLGFIVRNEADEDIDYDIQVISCESGNISEWIQSTGLAEIAYF